MVQLADQRAHAYSHLMGMTVRARILGEGTPLLLLSGSGWSNVKEGKIARKWRKWASRMEKKTVVVNHWDLNKIKETTGKWSNIKKLNVLNWEQSFSHKMWVWSKLWSKFVMNLRSLQIWNFSQFWYDFGMSLSWAFGGWHLEFVGSSSQTKNMEEKGPF